MQCQSEMQIEEYLTHTQNHQYYSVHPPSCTCTCVSVIENWKNLQKRVQLCPSSLALLLSACTSIRLAGPARMTAGLLPSMSLSLGDCLAKTKKWVNGRGCYIEFLDVCLSETAITFLCGGHRFELEWIAGTLQNISVSICLVVGVTDTRTCFWL